MGFFGGADILRIWDMGIFGELLPGERRPALPSLSFASSSQQLHSSSLSSRQLFLPFPLQLLDLLLFDLSRFFPPLIPPPHRPSFSFAGPSRSISRTWPAREGQSIAGHKVRTQLPPCPTKAKCGPDWKKRVDSRSWKPWPGGDHLLMD